MKTVVHIETTDAERLKLGNGKLISRKDLTTIVQEYVRELIEGRREEAEQPPAAPTEAVVADRQPEPGRDRSVCDFVPSRGDEPYLYKPRDPELAARLSALLDDAERFESYVWEQLERNRL